jgi:hypothetical protein
MEVPKPITIKLKSPPFSINSAFYRNGNRTQKCRKWGANIQKQLIKYEGEFTVFNDFMLSHIDSYCLSVDITHYYPRSKLLTKTGKINRFSMDLTNIEKMLVDLIFDKRHRDRGDSSLGLDDCLIVDLHSFKRLSPRGKPEITLTISILPNSAIHL